MYNGLLYRISIMIRRWNATDIVSVKVVHIKAPTSLYPYSLVINGITSIIKMTSKSHYGFSGFFSKMADKNTMNVCAVGPP